MAPKESAADTRRYFLQTAFLQKAVEASKIKVSKKEAEKMGTENDACNGSAIG